MKKLLPVNRWVKKKPGAAILGLALDGSRLEAVELRRSNGSVEIRQTLLATLTLDPLTAEPELVGREIRKQLDAAEIRERRCTVCLPLSWVLTLSVKLPEVSEEDIQSFLQIESERGFPYDPEELMPGQSRYRAPAGESYATLLAVPRDQVTRLEAVLQAAQLRPVSFSLGLPLLQPANRDVASGTLALLPGDSSVGLQLTSGGGLVVLRALEGAFDLVGAEPRLQVDQIIREARITLGQLPAEVRDTVRVMRVFGRGAVADDLADQLQERAKALELRLEQVRDHGANDFPLHLPSGTAISPALALGVQHLAGERPPFEFLPPKISAWQQLTQKYSSSKLVYSAGTAGVVVLAVALAFLVQQIFLWHWQSKWNAIQERVTELEAMQAQIKQYRPWFDESFRSLHILQRLTEAFPEDGSVSAKTVELRDKDLVTCSGTARDNTAWLKMLDQLRAAKGVTDVKVEQVRGRSPMEFTVNFRWDRGGAQ